MAGVLCFSQQIPPSFQICLPAQYKKRQSSSDPIFQTVFREQTENFTAEGTVEFLSAGCKQELKWNQFHVYSNAHS